MVSKSRSTNCVKIDHSNVNINIFDRELLSLSIDQTIHGYHTWPVKIKTRSITALEVRIHVHAVIPLGTILYQVQSSIELSQLMVATRGIGNNFCTSQTEISMWVLDYPYLLADLTGNYRVLALDHSDSHRCCGLSFDSMNRIWQLECMHIIPMLPRFEPSTFSVVVSMCQIKLWSNK